MCEAIETGCSFRKRMQHCSLSSHLPPVPSSRGSMHTKPKTGFQ
jgi:hypothetical protein